MDYINLNSFLKFGYFLKYRNPEYNIDLSSIDKNRYRHSSEHELIEEGIKLWKRAIESNFEINQKHVVPLSGGLDSRAILATLLEFTDASNIHTFTYGTPKTYDYDIGNKIAEIFGTKHVKIPLVDYEFSIEELVEISKRINHQTVLFYHPPLTVLDNLYSDFSVWSGAIIDVFFGIHTHKIKANNWNDAILNSFKENYFTKKIDLTNIKEKEFFKYIEYDKNIENVLVREHVIDLLNRQLKFVAPNVLMRGFNYKLLFTNTDLIDFALSIDNKYHDDQYFYKKMLLKAFPKYFSYPTKTSFGLPLNSNKLLINFNKNILRFKHIINNISPIFINPYTNYVDYNQVIRTHSVLRILIHENLKDLTNRKIIDWIDPEKIWNKFINYRIDLSKELLLLASLEIHMKAGLEI